MKSNEIFQASGTRLNALRQKLKARENKPGYEKNCEMIREEIARLETISLRPASETTSPDSATQSETATGATEPSAGIEKQSG